VVRVAPGVGTNFTPGTLTMDFAAPFSDGPGDAFAILTGSFWGPLASAARFEFLFDGLLQTAFTAALGPSQLFRFDLPGIVANRVRVTNISPDPAGVEDLAGMSFVGAGVTSQASATPEPGTLLLMGTALLGPIGAVLRQ
jgi:PEP-CTERM motif-containing protein